MCKAVGRQMKRRSKETAGGGRSRRRKERSGRTENTNEFVSKAKLTGSAGRFSRGESPVTSWAATSCSLARTLPGKR